MFACSNQLLFLAVADCERGAIRYWELWWKIGLHILWILVIVHCIIFYWKHTHQKVRCTFRIFGKRNSMQASHRVIFSSFPICSIRFGHKTADNTNKIRWIKYEFPLFLAVKKIVQKKIILIGVYVFFTPFL